MSTILEYYTRAGVKPLSHFFPAFLERISSDSRKYFDRTFILAPNNFKFEAVNEYNLTIRQVKT